MQDKKTKMVAMPPEVRALYEPLPGHVSDALGAAVARNPTISRLFAWTVELGIWCTSSGQSLQAMQEHPVWPRIEEDLAAITVQFAQDPDVARLLGPLGVATMVFGMFIHHVAGAELAATWMADTPMGFRRLYPEQETLFGSHDGMPVLIPLGTQTELLRLWPVQEWHRQLAGLTVEHRGRRHDGVPPEVFLARLETAMGQLRAVHPDYKTGGKIPITAIADQIVSSRQQFYDDLKSHHVDRARLRWWQPGQPIPLLDT